MNNGFTSKFLLTFCSCYILFLLLLHTKQMTNLSSRPLLVLFQPYGFQFACSDFTLQPVT